MSRRESGENSLGPQVRPHGLDIESSDDEYGMVETRRSRRSLECTPDEFRSKLENFFRDYISSARSDGNFNRTCFRMASLEFALHLRSPTLARIYYGYVLQECEEFISMDKKMVFNTLKEYITRWMQSHGYRIDNGFRYISRETLRYMMPHGLDIESSDDEFDFEALERKPEFVPKYEEDITYCTLEQLLYKPFVYQDFELVRNLLRYIMPVTFVTDDLYYYRKDVVILIKEKDPVLKRAKYCDYLIERNCRSYPARRLKLLLMSVDFMIRKRYEMKFGQNCIDSLKLFFENIPDARITSGEVNKFLTSIVKDLDRDAEKLVNDFCKKFEEEYCDSALPIQPRPLKHLSRCLIRRCLSLAQQLPVAIRRIGIPIALQKYISLEMKGEVLGQDPMVLDQNSMVLPTEST